MIYIELKEFLKYSKIETRSETSKFGDRSLGIPVELPTCVFLNCNCSNSDWHLHWSYFKVSGLNTWPFSIEFILFLTFAYARTPNICNRNLDTAMRVKVYSAFKVCFDFNAKRGTFCNLWLFKFCHLFNKLFFTGSCFYYQIMWFYWWRHLEDDVLYSYFCNVYAGIDIWTTIWF